MYRFALFQDRERSANTQELLDFLGAPAASVISGDVTGPATPTYPNTDALIAAEAVLQLVLIDTRTGFHAEQAIKSLQARIPVWIEGPLCLTTAAAWQILETARYTRTPLWVGAGPCRLSSQARSAIGSIRHFHAWVRSNKPAAGSRFPDGGLLYTDFYPFAALLAELLGPLEDVRGELPPGGDDAPLEQSGHAELRSTQGTQGYLDWAASSPASQGDAPEFSVQLEGSNGKLLLQGTIVNGRLRYASIVADGFALPDPGPAPALSEKMRQALSGHPAAGPSAFDSLRTVEWIDRIYTRMRKLS